MTTETTNSIKIIIADDHQLFAEGLENLLSSTGKYQVIAKVNNGKKLLQVLNSQVPDLILLDINMPLLTGTDAALLIRKKNPQQKIVFISMYYDAKLLQFCKSNQINGYLLKDTTANDVKNALNKIVAGELVYDHKITAQHIVTDEPKMDDTYVNRLKISKRELEIIQLIKQGNTSKEIAEQLFLSEFTIETHRKNIFRKLGVSSLSGLLQFVYAHYL